MWMLASVMCASEAMATSCVGGGGGDGGGDDVAVVGPWSPRVGKGAAAYLAFPACATTIWPKKSIASDIAAPHPSKRAPCWARPPTLTRACRVMT
ncbi:hypothetical protein BC940DRAFT_288098 [Gongronella butleri]|nr:hypothetical protein BC940DRAFT_288098 [Gongronella butleri]